MPSLINDTKILRLLDANLNRLLEGLRVCEEITRFLLCEPSLTKKFKTTRHNVIKIIGQWGLQRYLLLASRDSCRDVGKASIKTELTRKDNKSIFYANIQRSTESLRVLEEFSKLSNQNVSSGFKKLRYGLYQLEKETNTRL